MKTNYKMASLLGIVLFFFGCSGGSPSTKPPSLVKSVTFGVGTINFTPFVRDHVDPSLAKWSVPYNNGVGTCEIGVFYPGKTSGAIAAGDQFEVTVVNGGPSSPNGNAEIDTPSKILTITNFGTTVVSVKGLAQTTPGNAQALKLQIKQKGLTETRDSPDGFSVCAHPNAVKHLSGTVFSGTRNVFGGTFTMHGLDVDMEYVSDSGANSDLDKAHASEMVSSAYGISPWYARVLGTGGSSGWMTALPSNGVPYQDLHESEESELISTYNTAAGTHQLFEFNFDQVHVFACDRCGITKGNLDPKQPVIKNSGAVITRKIFHNASLSSTNLSLTVTKVGADTSARGYSAKASIISTISGTDPTVRP